jgi:hypothetical protein
MIIVSDYLKKLLYEQDCVVVPELGGFISHFNHAYFDSLNGQYYAPFKRIAFNEALKLDDGLLGQYISVNEQISREDANMEVCLFTENVKSEIKTNGRFYIHNLGVLMLNEDGKFLFEPETGINYFQEGFGLTTVSAKTVSLQKTLTEPTAEFSAIDREPVSLDQMASTNRQRSRSRVAFIAGGLILASVLFYAASDIKPSNSFRSSLNPFDILISNNSPITKKTTVDIKPVENKTLKTNAIVKPIETVAEKKSIETSIISVPIVAEIKKSVLPIAHRKIHYDKVNIKSDDSAKYFVIAGAFLSKDNADKLSENLKLNGFSESSVMPIDDRNLYKVSAVGFLTQNKAAKKMARVDYISKAHSWVLHIE